MLFLLACSTPEPVAEPPDVLIVVLDTLRADRTTLGGHRRFTTPQLTALAESGVRFADVTAPGSWTWPSHAALFTGEPPWSSGAHFAAKSQDAIDMGVNRLSVSPMRTDLPTLAERLGDAGWRTVALCENSFLDPVLGLTRGFGRTEVLRDGVIAAAEAELAKPGRLFLFVNLIAPHAPYRLASAPWSAAHAARLTRDGAPTWSLPYLAADAIDLTRGGGLRGWDLFARGELTIPPADMAMLLDLYDGEISRADAELRQIVKSWTGSGREGVVVVTSDHGEYFGEHGLLEHGRTVWKEVVDVPLVIAAPGRLPAGVAVTQPVQLQDVYPTVLELTGLSDPAWSLLDALAGTPRPGPIQAAEWPDVYKADVAPVYRTGWRLYRADGYSLVYAADGSRVELYADATDPRMTHDLANVHPAEAARLRAVADLAFAEAPTAAAAARLAPDSLEMLRQMGYVE